MSETIVEVDGLSKVYGDRRKEVRAVDGIDFAVGRNEVVGLLGANGAGKTTTIKCLCGLVTPTDGSVRIGGVDALAEPAAALRRIAAVLEGNRNVYWRLTPPENLLHFAGLQGISPGAARPEVDELLGTFGLQEKASTPARKLSRGMQQKLAVACALIKRTEVLLLDEPTLGLDVETSRQLRAALRRMAEAGERTILLSSHDMGVVQEICDRVIVIHQGRIVADDRVDNLLDLFRARAYRFELEAPLPDAARERLEDRFEMIRIDGASGIEVELLDGRALYELIDILRDAGATVESIDRQQPNLEEIYLHLVGRGSAPSEPPATA